MSNLPLLSFVIWLPIVGGLIILADSEREGSNPRPLALAFAMVTFLTSLLLYSGFDSSTAAMQFEEKASWISAFNVYYHLGVDGISMPLIILTTFTTVLVVLAVLLFLRPLSDPDTRVREAPAALLVPTWVLVIANIYFGINTELTVDIAETAARILGVAAYHE